MRALAIFSWLLAMALALVIVRDLSPMASGTARVVQADTLLLWRAAPAVSQSPASLPPVAAASSAPAPAPASVPTDMPVAAPVVAPVIAPVIAPIPPAAQRPLVAAVPVRSVPAPATPQLVVAVVTPVLPPAPARAEVVPVNACARLGIFPDRVWAESVAALVAAPEAGRAPPAEMSWRIQSVGRKGYYAVFDGMSMDVLAARMERRRSALSRLVSYAALPERCAGR